VEALLNLNQEDEKNVTMQFYYNSRSSISIRYTKVYKAFPLKVSNGGVTSAISSSRNFFRRCWMSLNTSFVSTGRFEMQTYLKA